MITLNRSAGIPARYANRHGLITGATGTGKSVSLMRLVEQFSRAGVPAFVADVKGDIAALARSCPAVHLDLFGQVGTPIRISFQAMGADLVARALELTDAQAGVVEVAFAYAADRRFRLASIADFRAVLSRIADDAKAVSAHYGHVTVASIGVVQRALMRLESQGGREVFAASAFDVADLLEPSRVSILKADRLMQSPRRYGAFLLWMLTDLYERLPEVGDLARPRLVFFFDEAHLLFQDCPAALLRRIEQTVRLIRSKGVGVYFVSQRPDDVPQVIRDQLAHRLEHDRALPVGTARFATMTADGRPAPMTTIKVDMPECPLGPLEAYELPEVTAPSLRPLPSRPLPSLPIHFLAGLGCIGAMIAAQWFR
ncbi:helicase HerA-like domain-containing protein [Bosea vestrisii]|uniref:Helicase HerA-like domain-containing protein n=1 Tax=Bosea vestrisii TaxID=151416 RepID=A0ABW0H7P5_9HYPH